MQRDRLEGWMVQQIQQADLAKETVIQLPTRASTAPANASPSVRSPRSPTTTLGSPRRRFLGHSVVQRPQSTQPSPSPSPGLGIRQRIASPRTPLEPATAVVSELVGEDSVTRQWRLHFQEPDQSFREEGRVDRSRVLKGLSPRSDDEQSAFGAEWGDGGRRKAATEESPLSLWGTPREYILEYIRQSVMPATWTTHARLTGEWEAVPPADRDGRYAPKEFTVEDSMVPFLTSLPPLASPSDHWRKPASPTARSPRATTEPSSPLKGYRRPHSGATTTAVPTSPRHKPPRCGERIHRVLTELRADPAAWEAFQTDVQQFLDDQRRKIRENKQRAAISPRAPAILADRKRRHDERVERVQRHRRSLIEREDAQFEAKLAEYRRRTQTTNQTGQTGDSCGERDVALSVGYRRRKTWLFVASFVAATAQLQQKLLVAKQRQVLEKMQTQAARLIQQVWKQFKWRHASKQTVVIYSWLRKCLWKLTLKMRCRRKRRLAPILQRFMLDYCSGSRETRNFNRMMVKWRGKVIVSQRLGLDFVCCTRARLAALALWWDRVDHERQRSERQGHDRLAPSTTEDKEGEWTAMVSNRGRVLLRKPSMLSGVTSQSPSVASGGGSGVSGVGGSVAAAAASAVGQLAASGSASSLSRRSVSTRQLLDQMDERLTTMQQVRTPIELQRMQQHACHVVKVPKVIKMRLLQELLTVTRKDYSCKLSAYHKQATCAGYSREVKLDDARAIVQSGASWGRLLINTATGSPKLRKPVFQLYTADGGRRVMEELVRKGVQLTLESDAEQRALLERQRHQRLALEAGASPTALASTGGSGGGSFMSSRKRESSGASMAPIPPPQASAGASSESSNERRKSTRKLTFAVPATIRERSKK